MFKRRESTSGNWNRDPFGRFDARFLIIKFKDGEWSSRVQLSGEELKDPLPANFPDNEEDGKVEMHMLRQKLSRRIKSGSGPVQEAADYYAAKLQAVAEVGAPSDPARALKLFDIVWPEKLGGFTSNYLESNFAIAEVRDEHDQIVAMKQPHLIIAWLWGISRMFRHPALVDDAVFRGSLAFLREANLLERDRPNWHFR